MAEGWRSRFSCASRRLPASRVRRSTSFASNSNWTQPKRMETWASISGLWRGGFTAIHARARFSSAKKTGLIVGFFERARACSRRKQAKQKRIQRPGQRNRLKERHEQIRHQRRNHALRAEVCGPRRRGPFSRNAQAGTFLSRNRHLPRTTGRKNGRRLYGGGRRGGRERHQRDRRRHQLPVSA